MDHLAYSVVSSFLEKRALFSASAPSFTAYSRSNESLDLGSAQSFLDDPLLKGKTFSGDRVKRIILEWNYNDLKKFLVRLKIITNSEDGSSFVAESASGSSMVLKPDAGGSAIRPISLMAGRAHDFILLKRISSNKALLWPYGD